MNALRVAAVLASLLALPVGAQNAPNFNDTVNCRWNDGRPMAERDCAFFRREKAAYDEQRRKTEEQLQAAQRRQDQLDAEREKLRAEQAERWKENAAAERARIERQTRESEESLERAEREEARREAVAAKRERDLKARCGPDYRAPRVGMSFERLKECAGPIRQYSEIRRADGIISVYTAPGVMIHVMRGQVVAWTRL